MIIRHNPSNLGKWNKHYEGVEAPDHRYGRDGITYRKAAEFLADCDVVEDWGCGVGTFRLYFKNNYIGIDGSCSKFADVITDLATYRSSADGILLRGVLEHNVQWEAILNNALASARHKLIIILFTPFVETTRIIAYYNKIDVPDIAFSKHDLIRHFDHEQWTLEEGLVTDTQYRIEHIFRITRPEPTGAQSSAL